MRAMIKQTLGHGGRPWMWFSMALLASALVLVAPAWAEEDRVAEPEFVTLRIGHRVHLNFRDEVTTKLGERQYVGDTEFTFEVEAFYPHFAIIDSTHEVVTLSDEPNNPAFKILVYEGDELVDTAWAFYAIDVPHYARTSLISFQAVAFEYRGKVYEKAEKNGADSKNRDDNDAAQRETEGGE